MDDLAMAVRTARPDDAQTMARIYIDAWHDTYAAILPMEVLCAMTVRGQTARWRSAISARGGEQILVAESACRGVIGLASFGPCHDRTLDFDGEVYTLYVAPDHLEQGVGSALLRASFKAMGRSHYTSCVIWAHARNPARYFYEALGGRLVAQRSRRLRGWSVPESAFGWRRLALADRSAAPGGDISRH